MKIFLERPFLFISLTYAAGIVLGTLTRYEIAWPWFALIALASFAILIFIWNPKIFLPIAFLLILSVGACSYQISQMVPAQDVSNPEFHGRGSLQGRVISEVNQKSKGKKEILSFTLRAESWFSAKRKVTLSGNVRVTLLNAKIVPSYGDELRIKGELSFPKSAVNPGEFDYRKYLENQDIRASLLGFGSHSIRVIETRPGLIRKIFDLRNAIHDRVYQLAPAPERDILLSLITGERTSIPREITDDFVSTGTVHVLAISGFQVSLVAGFVFLLLGWFGVSMRVAALISAAVLVFYVPLAGWQLPVQRAGIMGLVILGAVMLSRASDVITSIFFALFLLLVMNPNHLYSVAFQLSFISVLALMGISPQINDWLRTDQKISGSGSPQHIPWWKKVLRSFKITFASTLAATIGTFPLILFYFHVLSFTSLLANCVIVPLTTFALFTLIFVLAISLVWLPAAAFLIAIPVCFVKLSTGAAHFLAQFPLGYLYLPSPHWSMLVIYYGLLLMFITGLTKSWHPFMKRTFAIGTVGVLIAMLLPVFRTREEIVILNVPGSSVIFSEDRLGRTVLFNGGRGESFAQDYWTVIPFLKARGIKKLDQVFMTSMKRKFWSGLVRISNHCKFRSVATRWPYSRESGFDELIHKIRQQKGSLSGLTPGNQFLISESTRVDVIDAGSSRLNSCALVLNQRGMRVLILEEDCCVEEIKNLSGQFLHPEILYVSAKSIQTVEMLDTIAELRPQALVLANGPTTIPGIFRQKLEKAGISLFNLKQTGAITLRPGDGGFEVTPYISTTCV
ncbi:MAG: ComEC/Rec2 family competence protein [Candidatus Omnitrophica bacterium]|nr:ComEC/Rec2 family competence protein [Candidatus Omnitrophota bacterium]